MGQLSVLSHDPLAQDTSCEFLIDYAIAANAPSGITDLNFKVVFSSPNVYPPVWYPAQGAQVVIDGTPPQLSLIQPAWLGYAASTTVVPTDGATKIVRGPAASFYASDPESGIADFQIYDSSGTNLAAEYFAQSGAVGYSANFSEGEYNVTTLNNSGASATGRLQVDYTPLILVSSYTTREVGSGDYLDDITFIGKAHWGLGLVKLLPAAFTVSDPLDTASFDSALAVREYNGNGVSSATFTLLDVPPGDYRVYAKNAIGSLSASPVSIHSATNFNSGTGIYDHTVEYQNPLSSYADSPILLNFEGGEKLAFHISYESLAFPGLTSANSIPVSLPQEITQSYFGFPYGFAFDLKTTAGFSGNATIRVDYRQTPFTQAQMQGARLYAYDGANWVNMTSSRGDGWVEGVSPTLSKMVLVFPYPASQPYTASSSAQIGGAAEAELVSYLPAVTLAAAATEQAPISGYISSAETSGQYLVSNVFVFAGNGAELVPPGAFKMRYSPSQLSRVGVSTKTLSVMCAFGGSLRQLNGSTSDGFSISAAVNSIPDACGLFSTVKPIIPDMVPPESMIQYGGMVYAGQNGEIYMGPSGNIGLYSYDSAQEGVQPSGLKNTYYAADASSGSLLAAAGGDYSDFIVYMSTFNLLEGTSTVTYFALDKAGNMELPKRVVIGADYSSPETVLVPNENQLLSNGVFYTSGISGIVLQSEDVVYGGAASGVSSIKARIDAGRNECQLLDGCAAYVYSAPVMAPEGAHTLHYWAEDNVGNLEDELTQEVFVDTVPPKMEIYVDSAVISVDVFNLALGSSITLSAVDPIVGGSAAGLKAIGMLIDTDPASCVSSPTYVSNPGTCDNPVYTQPFSLSEGYHNIYLRPVDAVGNMELPRSVRVAVGDVVDDLAPQASLVFREYDEEEYGGYISSETFIGVLAEDMPGEGEASGVLERYYWVAPSTSPLVYSQDFRLNEGISVIWYAAKDLAGNLSVAMSSAVRVDGTAPQVELGIQGEHSELNGVLYSAYGSSVVITAEDILSNGVMSGGVEIHYLVDLSTASCEGVDDDDPAAPVGTCANTGYAGPFALAPGTHTVYYTAEDRVGNEAAISSVTVVVAAAAGPAGVFSPTGSLNVARYGYSATLLTNGKVLIAGGQAGAPLNNIASAELYDPVTGLFGATGSLSMAREGHSAIALPDGKVLIIGGARDGEYLDLAELYDPAAGTFSPAGTMNVARMGAAVALLPDGTVLVAGGRTHGNVEISSSELYDPVTRTFSNSGSMGTQRAASGAVLLDNGKVLVLGGAIGGTFLNSAELYDPETGSFTPTGPMLEGRYWVKPTLLNDGKVLVVGGPVSGAELYDPASGTFSATSPMSSARLTGTAVKLQSGNVLVAGGADGADLATAEIYGAAAGTFSPLPDMSAARGGITGVRLADGRVLIAGGYGGGYQTSAELFVPAGWTPGTPPVPTAQMSPSSGPIGVPFTIDGTGFGTYSAALNKVLIGGAVAQLTLWTDTQIKGTVPGALAAGPHAVTVARGTSTLAAAGTFQVLAPQAEAVLPSSGAIGVPFTITGSGFGNYAANYTRVLIGGATAPLTLWSDTQIKGTVPGALAAGDYELVVERAINGGVTATQPLAFKVLAPELYAIIPTSGSIGVGFTLTGANFGNYVANYTRVLIGGATAPLTLWTDGQIKGTVPGSLVSGTYDVLVERELNGGLARSEAVQFTLVAPVAASVAPSSGAIGVPFTINGSSFGNFVAGYTKVLIGDTTCPLTLWSDTQIKGTVPGALAAGDYELLVTRELNGGIITTQPIGFRVLAPEIAALVPSSGAIGVPFTINGANFGNYVANYTRVLIGGATAPLTLWTDTQIKGTVPGALAAGELEVYVERALNSGLVRSSSAAFTVLGLQAAGIMPSSGPIGVPFTITGEGFGNYVANYTRVLIGGATAPLTLWTDGKIQGTIPGALADGEHEVYVERSLNGGITRSGALSFLAAGPQLAQVTPGTAAVLAPFTLTGYNFGNYVANYTRVLIGGATTQLTLWTDLKIQGKLPALGAGEYPVLVQRQLNGGLSESATAYISVVEPYISSMTPVSGAVGTVFNIYGTGFGPYDASIARVFVGGAQCALSLWTDTQIRGTVPGGIGYGTHTVVAMRGNYDSDPVEFVVPVYTPSMFRIGNAQEFRLGEVYVYPDPAKGGKAPVFHIEVGTADTVKIKVYTVAGQLAHEATLTGNPQAVGTGYAYEYQWTGRIASGVYYYTVEAERSGKKLKTRGKFAVVR